MALRAQYVEINLTIKQIDEAGRVMKELPPITKLIEVGMHRSTDHRVLEMNGAIYDTFGWLDTGAVAGSITSPAVVCVYSPDKPFRIALNPPIDLTTIAEFDDMVSGANGCSAPSGHLFLLANLDGDDTGLDKIDFANAEADSGANDNDAHPTVLVSGD
jgi:hypothetical protein